MSQRSGRPALLDLQTKIEEVMIREKKIYPNVDFYSGTVYSYLGLPTDLFTPIFALSRMAGWTAHAMEQYGDNRLMRPRAEYSGPMDVPYIPIDQR